MPRVSRITSDGQQRPQQRVKPVQERSRKKIDAILDATASLLELYGVEAASTSAIAEKAGIPVATVYHYFENRLAVFAALAQRTMGEVDTQLEQLLAEQLAAPVPEWRSVLALLFDAYSKAPGYTAVLTALKAEPALQEIVHESNQRIANVLGGVLMVHTSLSEDRAARVAWIMSETCEVVLQKALASGEEEKAALLDELSSIVEALFGYYVGTLPSA